ncbi:MAG: ABC transporter permease [Bacteroidales bacterium]|jgi:putative ABC transport system permease protein
MRKLLVHILSDINISIKSFMTHKTRFILTVLIISIGITALVGILTSIEGLQHYLTENFKSMGSNTLTIHRKWRDTRGNVKKEKGDLYRRITYKEAVEFKNRFSSNDHLCSISNTFSGTSTVQSNLIKTNPNISVIGSDENYLTIRGYDLSAGRFFSSEEASRNSYVVVIGSTIADKLFSSAQKSLNQTVKIGSTPYRVIGVLEDKGMSMGFDMNNICIIPIHNARIKYETDRTSYKIDFTVSDTKSIEKAEEEATGIFRVIRKNKPSESNSFEIDKGDSILSDMNKNLRTIRIVGLVISIVTLLASAIALMNIMLISVTERTHEIGLRKAIGANNNNIRTQFLLEAIIIAQIGGLLGIILGVALGNIISIYLKISFFIPWNWILVSVLAAFIVAIISGIAPANKAASLNPIDSLRAE